MVDGLTYLRSRTIDRTNLESQAFVQYVRSLAGDGDLAEAQALLAQADLLQPFGQAVLAMALHKEGDTSGANLLVDRLLADRIEKETIVYWPTEGVGNWDWAHWHTMASAEKNTAAAIQAITQIRPGEPRLPKAVRWLMDQRQSASRYYRGAGWRNTQATAFAVLGLLDYIKASSELESNYAYTVKLDGNLVVSGQVTPQNFSQPIEPIVLAGTSLTLGKNQLTIERTSGEDGSNRGALYYTSLLSLDLFYSEFEQVSSNDQGIQVTRLYELVEGTPRDDGAYNIGDVVRVTVWVSADSDKGYVYVTSPLPAGFEAINYRLNTAQYTGEYERFYWRDWGYNRKDLRDDRVDYFITRLYHGTQTFSYLMRAVTAGEFSVLPAEATPHVSRRCLGTFGQREDLGCAREVGAASSVTGRSEQ